MRVSTGFVAENSKGELCVQFLKAEFDGMIKDFEETLQRKENELRSYGQLIINLNGILDMVVRDEHVSPATLNLIQEARKKRKANEIE